MTLTRESHERSVVREWLSPRPIATIAVAAAIVWSTTKIVDGWKASRQQAHVASPFEKRAITASGVAKRHVEPDHIRWDVTVESHAPDQRTARRHVLASAEAARSFLVAHGIRAEEISVFPPSMEDDTKTVVHRHADGTEDQDDVPNGTVATQKLSISSTEIARVLRAYRDVTSSPELDLGELDEPSCGVAHLDRVEQELMPAARAALRRRAEATVAEVGGARLGRLATIDAGSFSASGIDTASLEACEHGADAVASVNATFELE